MAFNCPHCGMVMSESVGPSYTVLSDVPQPKAGAVVMLSCIGCQKALGPYVIPAPTK